MTRQLASEHGLSVHQEVVLVFTAHGVSYRELLVLRNIVSAIVR
ncbi:MAG: hypothetical protein ACREE6_00705 [Limisphaerales bacterium]